jgi:hypothetical protein
VSFTRWNHFFILRIKSLFQSMKSEIIIGKRLQTFPMLGTTFNLKKVKMKKIGLLVTTLSTWDVFSIFHRFWKIVFEKIINRLEIIGKMMVGTLNPNENSNIQSIILVECQRAKHANMQKFKSYLNTNLYIFFPNNFFFQ